MAIVYPVMALIGGLVSCVLLWPYGATVALLSMPFAGSLLALAAAFMIYRRTTGETGQGRDRAVTMDRTRTLRTTESR
ncbi:hypothetical protein [Microvirga lotononidis]|uniref:Uncharacterized protein n=1 Tax=Microvirga lotononidis TaxID=864069 RepID=I4YWV7_9HYPH|nr:hypothetical protein [Microvirga lotononidis]EIM28449.1 hypothetical protein MicloDRAFT_00050340 [Microvirga lotononidis]WQO27473.1 hypothetical protein U0023_23015 [Microvirga lotononidis]